MIVIILSIAIIGMSVVYHGYYIEVFNKLFLLNIDSIIN